MEIYGKGRQLNRWPYTQVVSAVLGIYRGGGKGKRFLEIGCGTGNNLWFAADAGFEVAGIDISSTALSYATKRLNSLGFKNFDLCQGDVRSLPWPNESFDFVLDRMALTHNPYESIACALHDVHRVLRSGGHMMSTFFGKGHHERALGTEVARNAYDHFSDGYFADIGLTSFVDDSDLRELFAEFRNLKISRHTTVDCSQADDCTRNMTESYTVLCSK